MKSFYNTQMCFADLAKVNLNYLVYLADEVHVNQEHEKEMEKGEIRFQQSRQMALSFSARYTMKELEKSL